tara:strand:+ start:751 stop:1272 length:522 start_codon:yes stop_codon:yes gene_type:complete
MSWYGLAITNYFNFSGRARRKEYWMFYLFSMIIYILAMILDFALGINYSFNNGYYEQSLGYGPIYTIVGLFHFIPMYSITVRRLHDSDRTGWWFFGPILAMLSAVLIFAMMAGMSYSMNIRLLMYIGGIIAIVGYIGSIGVLIASFVFMFFDGTKGDNRFGPSNKYDSEGELI